MLEIIREINHLPRALVHIKRVNAPRPRSHRRESACSQIRAKNMCFALNADRKKDRASRGPAQFPGDVVEILHSKLRGCATSGVCDIQFRKLVNRRLSCEKNL